jgi:flagellar biosynthesis/type III secretory pathway protein FliH
VARLAAAAIDDAVAREMADHAAVHAEEAFNDGHDAGYRRGLEDGRAETRRPARTPSAAVPHRTVDRTTPVSRLDAHQVARRGRNNDGRGGRGGIA